VKSVQGKYSFSVKFDEPAVHLDKLRLSGGEIGKSKIVARL
jgi:hypothetical protein